jgi:hypothetical protein
MFTSGRLLDMRLTQFKIRSKIGICLERLKCDTVAQAIKLAFLNAAGGVIGIKCHEIRLFLALFGLGAEICLACFSKV